MLTNKVGSTLEVDIHGMTADDAKRQLEILIGHADKNTKEIVIIHGYSHGQVLKKMVQIQLKHPRIASKLLSLNEGQTRILLKPAEK